MVCCFRNTLLLRLLRGTAWRELDVGLHSVEIWFYVFSTTKILRFQHHELIANLNLNGEALLHVFEQSFSSLRRKNIKKELVK